jgi:hypothetical protein
MKYSSDWVMYDIQPNRGANAMVKRSILWMIYLTQPKIHLMESCDKFVV